MTADPAAVDRQVTPPPWRRAVGLPVALVESVLYRREPDAAGTVSLYRILYGLFYLWHLALYPAAALVDLPQQAAGRVGLLLIPRKLGLPFVPPTVLEFGLVAALVGLVLGWRTRLATLLVLCLGLAIETQCVSLQPQLARVFLTFYLPLFMLIAGDWGACYSLDAVRRRSAGRPRVHPRAAAAGYYLPARAALLVLAALFLGAAVTKTTLGGTWLHEPRLMASIALDKNVKAALYDLPMTPLIPAFAARPWLYGPSLYVVLAFEATFCLALFGRPLRTFYTWLALAFHSANAVFLLVTFTPVLIVYPLFLNLQSGLDRVAPRRLRELAATTTAWLAGRPTWQVDLAAALAAIGFAAAWMLGSWLPQTFLLGGWLDWQTINLPVLPAAVAGLIVYVWTGLRRVRNRP